MPSTALALSIAFQLLAAAPAGDSPRAQRPSPVAAQRTRDAGAQPQRQPGDRADAIDVSGYPPEQKAQYAVFRRRCGKCHSLSIAASARYTTAQAKRHTKRPGVAITDVEIRSILGFLEFDRARRASR